MRHRLLCSFCIVGVAVAGCGGDAPLTAPPPPPPTAGSLSIAALSGSSQDGMAGEKLAAPIVVQVRDQSGLPVPGARISFLVALGDGTVGSQLVVTNTAGQASTAWTLGWNPGPQEVMASVVSNEAAPARFTATARVNPSADLIVIRAGGAPFFTVVDYDAGWQQVYRRGGVDTLIYRPPQSQASGSEYIVVFASRLPPAIHPAQWTEAPDTVLVELSAALRIPVTIWIFENFAAEAAVSRSDVENTNAFFRNNPWGLEIGHVRTEDVTDYLGPPVSCQVTPFREPATINVYYSTAAAIGFGGYSCSASMIIIKSMGRGSQSFLMAHELGHSFGLGHETDPANFMNPTAAGGWATPGQIFRAHFAPWSALIQVYALRPTSGLPTLLLPIEFSW